MLKDVVCREYPAGGPDGAGYRAALRRRQGQAGCEVLLSRAGHYDEQVCVVGDVPVDVLRAMAEGGPEYWEDGHLVMRLTEAGIRVAGTPGGAPALSGGLVLPAGWVLQTLTDLEADLRRGRRRRGLVMLLVAAALGAVVAAFWVGYHVHVLKP